MDGSSPTETETPSEYVFYSDGVLLHNQGERTPLRIRVDMLDHLRRVYQIQGKSVSEDELREEARYIVAARLQPLNECAEGIVNRSWRAMVRAIVRPLFPSDE